MQSVWPGGEVELPEFELEGDPLVVPALPRCRRRKRITGWKPVPLEGLRAVILGLARVGETGKL